jgi:phage repressor protein C with HTH and peptisase S24 domain
MEKAEKTVALQNAVHHLMTNRLIKRDADIAASIDYNKTTVSQYLNGKQTPSSKFIQKFESFYKLSLQEFAPIANVMNEDSPDYIAQRRNLKATKQQTLMYYEIGATAGHSAEILPVKKSEGTLHISDLFRGSEFAIRISGNSMMPNYPPGAIIGIREIQDKQITPGSVYVIETGNDLWK